MKALGWVKNHLELNRIAFDHLSGPPAAHFDRHRLLKTIVATADGKPVVLVVPASRRLCLDRVLDQLGAHTVKLANEAESRLHFPDCEPGAVPPLRHWNGASLVADPSIETEGDVYFFAGTHHDVIRLAASDWLRFAHPRQAPVANGFAGEAQAACEARTPGERLCGSPEQLSRFVVDLLEVLHLQAKELERLVGHVEQYTQPLDTASQLSVCASELSELKSRLTTHP